MIQRAPAAPAAQAPAAPAAAPAGPQTCPDVGCACNPSETGVITAARDLALKALDQTLQNIPASSAAASRHEAKRAKKGFTGAFGSAAADDAAYGKVRSRIGSAASFLRSISVGSGLYCDFGKTSSCGRGFAGYYNPNRQAVVVCTRTMATALREAAVNPFDRTTIDNERQEVVAPGPDLGTTILKPEDDAAVQNRLQEQKRLATSRLASLLIHEALHHAIQPGLIDVYSSDRLFDLFGSKRGFGVRFSAAALDNPDSHVELVRLMTSGVLAPEPPDHNVHQNPDVGSSEIDVEPLLGRKRIEIAVRLARQTLSETRRGVEAVATHMVLTEWKYYPQLHQDMVSLLSTVGGVAGLDTPGGAAGSTDPPVNVLGRIEGRLNAFLQDLNTKTLVVRREGSATGKKQNEILILVPKHSAFRAKSEPDKILMILRQLPTGKVQAQLPEMAVEFSKQHGILRGFQ